MKPVAARAGVTMDKWHESLSTDLAGAGAGLAHPLRAVRPGISSARSTLRSGHEVLEPAWLDERFKPRASLASAIGADSTTSAGGVSSGRTRTT